MVNKISAIYITMMPIIFTGILNMAFCTANVCKKLNKPLDGGKCMKDGKRILGDNKTFKGLIGYIVIGIVMGAFWGLLCSVFSSLENRNYIYINHDNTFLYNCAIGGIQGLAYAIFELPNSFLKRRFNITPGKTTVGLKKYLFILYDQCDSVIGCGLVLAAVYPMGVAEYFMYLGLGILTHLVGDVVLYMLKLRKNIL